ncbi:hypothetical protein CC1G_04834 [Coprinopsis cinerea okayama7|uniref:Uncharacterized protein n=1 Tax=Coprinopsis cinerea (strain Okayama-7 / 130 / ATCC MYA-4618 / FGSC 9003) TaxID=240176 RepID=A8PFR1_COPC7|nr:hypothetical protein CC1G_04834 [Coprinopsis cinerea okayama7\|eukprot:XP_001840990.2 hypothetical protein CC1G_04834 [Coprinopsis cinerea okayama7\
MRGSRLNHMAPWAALLQKPNEVRPLVSFTFTSLQATSDGATEIYDIADVRCGHIERYEAEEFENGGSDDGKK